MLKIDANNIEIDGSATELLLEWGKLTHSLAEKLSDATGTKVTIDTIVTAVYNLIKEETK
jgi:hypothetical protein